MSDFNFLLWLGKSVNHTFPYINLSKTIKNSLVVWKITKMWLENLYFQPCTFDMNYKAFSFKTSLSGRDRNNDKFTCCLEIQSKIAELIPICTLNSLKLPKNQIHIC